MIVTAQPFLNELDLIEIKIRELDSAIDEHILVEADRTYSGMEKAFNFMENSYLPVWRKVCSFSVQLPESAASSWDREKFQHEEIRRRLVELKPDIVIWLDADEIPRRDVVERFLAMEVPEASLEMDHLMFFFNRRCTWMKWPFPKISRWPHAPHRHDNCPVIPNAGWHCQNFGPKERVVEKLDGFSHAGQANVIEFKEKYLRGEYPGIEDCEPYDDYPQFVKDNRERFAQYFI